MSVRAPRTQCSLHVAPGPLTWRIDYNLITTGHFEVAIVSDDGGYHVGESCDITRTEFSCTGGIALYYPYARGGEFESAWVSAVGWDRATVEFLRPVTITFRSGPLADGTRSGSLLFRASRTQN